jgi:hypothetical protein
MTRERNVVGGLDVHELEDDEGNFLVVAVNVDGADMHLELEVVAAMARLRNSDQEAFESVADLIELFLERGAPLEALDG